MIEEINLEETNKQNTLGTSFCRSSFKAKEGLCFNFPNSKTEPTRLGIKYSHISLIFCNKHFLDNKK